MSFATLSARVQDLADNFTATGDALPLAHLISIGDQLTRRHVVGMADLSDLLSRWPAHGYRPTIRTDVEPELGLLGDIYDIVAEAQGLDVKAYRG